MAARAIAIEIGYSLTKICEVDYKAKTHKIYKSFTVPNGAEVISDGALMVSPEYVENLRSALSANHVKGKQVVFTITSSKIASREVTIPYVKENRIADVVNANATDYFPVDLSQYQLAYTILGTIGETKGAQQYKLLVMAVPTALLSGYYELAKALKLEVAAIDYAGNSIFQVVKDECAKGRHIVVKIDERSSLVMAVENSVLSFTRSVSYGVEEIMDTVMNTLCWGEVSSVEQAIRVLQRNECIVPEEDAGDSESAEENAKSAKDSALEDMREAVIPLIGGITRVIDYYASRNSGAGIERILITGMGADFKGMDEMLSRETNMPVAVLKEAAGWNLMRNFKNECFSEYIACVGAAVAPLGFKQEPEKRSKGKAKKEAGEGGTNWAPLAYTVFGVGLVAAAALVAVPMIGYAKLTKTNMELKAQAGSLEDIIPIYNEYVEVKAEHAMADAMYEATESRNESLEEFLGELEDKLPANVNVISFSSDAYEVSINMRVQTKDDAGAAVEQMRTFQSLIPERVTVASLVEEENEESGERVVNFTVTAAYQDVGYMLEEELPEENGAAADSVTDGANADMAESEAREINVSYIDVLLLLGSFGVLAVVSAYMLVFQPTMEKTEALKEENLQLEARIADLQSKKDNKDSYESQTAQMRREIDEIYQLFPVDVREENAVYLAINQELLSPMEVQSVTIDALLEVPFVDEVQQEEMPDATYEIDEVEEIEDATGTQEAPTPEAGDTQGAAGVNPYHLMNRKTTINYEVSYEGLKRSVKNICMQTDRMVIDNLSVVYDEQTGLLRGTTTVNMFCVPNQEGKEYEEPDFAGVLLGTDNIFGTRVIRSEGSLPDLEDGAEGGADEEQE